MKDKKMSKNIEEMIEQINKLDDEIFALQQPINPKIAELSAKKSAIKSELDLIIAKDAAENLKNNDYGCGTFNLETDRYKIKTVVSKKVKWDEGMLLGIEETIKEAGQNPRDFIKQKLSVSETSYKTFPDNIKEVFEPARSVEPSAPKITIERK